MDSHWKKKSQEEIKSVVFDALDKNINYSTQSILGVPASYLDEKVFTQDASFVKDAPFISSLIQNPNHIGCHTLGKSESFFEGTHAIEKNLIEICAVDILKGKTGQHDGYVASGGTEANIQAIWILKRYYETEFGAQPNEIGLIYSEDAHYSMPKASKLLSLQAYVSKVDDSTRRVTKESITSCVQTAREAGVKHFILVINMSTTMFGSVDDVDEITGWLDVLNIDYTVHVDAAFGGYIYPFSNDNSKLTFQNPKINSFTLDGHKMLQSPYGTGIYLTRKGFMEYALTEEANYVKGKDYTLVGSRSGANAIAIWMIMRTYGSDGWKAKIQRLLAKTTRLCSDLDERGVEYFRNPDMNIVTIRGEFVSQALADKYMLVPDAHGEDVKWWKIVVMEHVKQGVVDNFLRDLDLERG